MNSDKYCSLGFDFPGNYMLINCTSFGTPSVRFPEVGSLPLALFAKALKEYKSTQTFQQTILYTKKMLEETYVKLYQDKLYSQSLGMEDFICQSFRLKPKA